MSGDRRAAHWLQAEALLSSAEKLSRGRDDLETVRIEFWLCIAEAQVHAALASAPIEVAQFINQHEAEVERQRIDEIVAFKKKVEERRS